MCTLATDRETTIVRPIEMSDRHNLLRLLDTAWRVHLRISPTELHTKIESVPSYLAEDRVGLRGFIMVEPVQPEVGLVVAASLRDTWSVKPYLDLLLPKIEQASLNQNLQTLVYIGNAPWMVDELRARGFATQEWIMGFERQGTDPPTRPKTRPAQMRTAHFNDLPALLVLDKLAFNRLWHKSMGNFSQALARAASFAVAIIDDKIVAYEWCELYGDHAHLTRLAVHPNYQGRGIGAQLLYQAITDALTAGANLITLNTQENNRRSRALYRRFGFVDTHQRMPVLWKKIEQPGV